MATATSKPSSTVHKSVTAWPRSSALPLDSKRPAFGTEDAEQESKKQV